MDSLQCSSTTLVTLTLLKLVTTKLVVVKVLVTGVGNTFLNRVLVWATAVQSQSCYLSTGCSDVSGVTTRQIL